MAYESLYRRYRPQRFSEVRGQHHVVTALHNAVRENRVGHAYLLSGPRGTGKTTTARILAKALNCTNLADGEPCGECASCQAIEAGTSYDLLELDAASNNGVDAMRDLIAKAALGSPGRTKVYLLDEVHMLSTGASNALLKTLEEPPGHVVFVLATTDPHKVLPTIRSRTQHFELHLLAAKELRDLVEDVVADAGLDVDEDAIQYALRAGGGSARDTLSALDQVVAAGGVLDRGDQVDDLVDALAAHDTGAALRAVSDSVSRGHDPRVVGEALLARIRDVFLHRMGDPLELASAAEREKASAWAQHFSDRACTQALEGIGDALRDMRSAPDARIPLEVALVRLTHAVGDSSLESLTARVERLERGAPSRPQPTDVAPTDHQQRSTTSGTAQGSTRPGDAARAALGARTEPPPTGASIPKSTAPRASTPAPVTPPPDVPGQSAPRNQPEQAVPAKDHPEQATGATPTTSGASESTSPATDAAPSTAKADLTLATLNAAWTEKVLPRLSGLTKAMFSVGHFVDLVGGRAHFAVPNEVHREKSLQKLGEVQATLQATLGHEVLLDLVVDGSTTSTHRSAPTAPQTSPGTRSSGNTTTGSNSDPTREDVERNEVEDIGPLDELTDAPSDDRNATQRLLDAFPGAEVVE